MDVRGNRACNRLPVGFRPGGMRLRPLVVVLGLVVAGCAGGGEPAAPPVSIGSDLPAAAPAGPGVDFPVTAVPRPIVLTGPQRETVERAEGEKVKAEELGFAGEFRFTGVAPPSPGSAPVVLPDGPATLPLIGVADAVAAMSAEGRGGVPLDLVSVELGTASFHTDRGPVQLPAWRFRSVFGSVFAWPAITPEAFWKPGGVPHSNRSATTSDGVELSVELGAPFEPCPGGKPVFKEPVAVESETSVRITVRITGGPLGDCLHRLLPRSQSYPVKLAAPLGSRLLLDEDNGVIPVVTR